MLPFCMVHMISLIEEERQVQLQDQLAVGHSPCLRWSSIIRELYNFDNHEELWCNEFVR